MAGNYEILATSKTPALIVYLLDVSGSMSDAFDGGSKIDCVNKAIADILQRMVARSTKGELVSPRYRLAMAAYSDSVYDMLGGIEAIDRVAEKGKVTLSTVSGTDTYSAFVWARDLLRRELPNLRGKPAPLVCHLTDGRWGEGVQNPRDPKPIAQEIMQMSNDDGNVLVENIYIGPDLTTNPIENPKQWPGIFDVSELRNPYAKELFPMSSSLPGKYAEMMAVDGYSLRAGCRMLIPGSSPELVQLAFTMSTSTPTGG